MRFFHRIKNKRGHLRQRFDMRGKACKPFRKLPCRRKYVFIKLVRRFYHAVFLCVVIRHSVADAYSRRPDFLRIKFFCNPCVNHDVRHQQRIVFIWHIQFRRNLSGVFAVKLSHGFDELFRRNNPVSFLFHLFHQLHNIFSSENYIFHLEFF